MNLSEIFNTREIAYVIWSVIILILFSIVKKLQTDVRPVLKSLLAKNFVPIYIIIVLYTTITAFILNRIGVWDISLIKDTIVWMVFAALPLLYKIAQAKDLKLYFISMLGELFQVSFIIEFMMGLHTFNLWIELILVPFTTMLGLLILFSKRDKKNKRVTSLFRWISIAITVCIFWIILNYISDHAIEYWDWSYLKQFGLQIELSVFFVPFLYLFAAYLRFEFVFCISLKNRINSQKLLNYTKVRLVRSFITNLEGLKRWQSRIFLAPMETKADILKSIQYVKEVQSVERNPIQVKSVDGWPPYEAKDYLKDKGLFTGFYNDLGENEWYALPTLECHSEDIFGNVINYGVQGNKMAVTELELTLKIFDIRRKSDSHEIFLDHIEFLYYKVFNKELSLAIINAVIAGGSYNNKEDNFGIILNKREYENKKHGYQLEFIIRHEKHVVIK